MIEPQNSMIPLAAEPRPVDAPQGDSIGFGEMLAQSLGLVAQVDPHAVQQIDTGPNQQHGRGQFAESDAGSPSALQDVASPTAAAGTQTTEQTPASSPSAPGLPSQPADGLAPGAGAAEVRSLVRPDGERGPVMPGDGPIRTLPTPPTPVASPTDAGPIDTIWKPGLATAPEAADTPALAESSSGDPAPAQAPGLPVVGPETRPAGPGTPAAPQPTPVTAPPPTDGGVDPMSRPPANTGSELPTHPPVANPTNGDAQSLVASVQPSNPLSPKQVVRPGTGRQLPPPPSPLGDAAATEQPAELPEASSQHVWPRAVPPSRVDLSPDTPVHLGNTPSRVATSPVGGTASELPVPVVGDSPTLIEGQGSFTIPGGESQVAAGPGHIAQGEAAPIQPSALAERVMQAVDLQRTQPPPRSMVVDIPEIEGLRLVVSVRSGGQVSVTPALGSTNPDAFAPFADDLSRVLSDRGFVMTGDGQRRGRNPYVTEEQQPPSRRSATFRRPAPTDNDLRI